jgi:hypothetical protein
MSSAVLTNGAAANGHYDAAPASAQPAHRSSEPELIRNDPSKSWVVQKFGGTSVGKVPTEIAENIIKQHLSQYQVAVVCSARSSETKSAGTTNR